MRMLEKNKKRIYHSKKVVHPNGAEFFQVPVSVLANVVPITAVMYTSLLGLAEHGRRVFSVDTKEYGGVFSNGDRFYVDTSPPPVEEYQGDAHGADYVITGIAATINVITITLDRMK